MEKVNLVSDNLRTVSIDSLVVGNDNKSICFVVPSYQRGYRWGEEQILKLLDDLLEYSTLRAAGDMNVGEFYCLQPVVLKRLSGVAVEQMLCYGENKYKASEDVCYYEVVDGQQRLTTIYILLKFFANSRDKFFDIEYQRDSVVGFSRRNFLLNIASKKAVTNADEHHFAIAYESIESWFELMEKKHRTNTLFDTMKTTLKSHTKIIWYELPFDNSIDCYEVFKNINNGKIPLTDSELVKAMLLNSKYYSSSVADKETNDKIIRQEQERWARLWDEIANTLNNNELWSFITGNHNFFIQTRIDFLLYISVLNQKSDLVPDSNLRLFTFYEQMLTRCKTVAEKRAYAESVFEEIRQIFRTVEDWFNNPQIYNYIGYMISYTIKGKTEQERMIKRLKCIIELRNKYIALTRSQFISQIKSQIKNDLNVASLDELNYESDRLAVEKLLMLFNIEILNSLDKKFAFYIGEDKWSVEHIDAQHSAIAKAEDREEYLSKEKVRLDKYIQKEKDSSRIGIFTEIASEIESMLQNKELTDEKFMSAATRIRHEVDGFLEEDMHKMGNLALLSKNDNSSFNNSPFYEKRKLMLGWLGDKNKNIPYATEKVFTKSFCKQTFDLDFTKWCKSDFEDYFDLIKKTLAFFVEQAE